MPDDETPTESERAVLAEHGEVEDDLVARATDDPPSPSTEEAAWEGAPDPGPYHPDPRDARAGNPNSEGRAGLEGDMGVSSGRTTAQHRRSDETQEVSPGSYDAPDVSTDDEATSEDYTDKTWGGPMRVSGEPKPAPIEDEKSRRDTSDPTPLP